MKRTTSNSALKQHSTIKIGRLHCAQYQSTITSRTYPILNPFHRRNPSIRCISSPPTTPLSEIHKAEEFLITRRRWREFGNRGTERLSVPYPRCFLKRGRIGTSCEDDKFFLCRNLTSFTNSIEKPCKSRGNPEGVVARSLRRKMPFLWRWRHWNTAVTGTLSRIFKIMGPTFELMVVMVVDYVNEKILFECFKKWKKKYFMPRLILDNISFKYHNFAQYATDATFQQSYRRDGSYTESETVFITTTSYTATRLRSLLYRM